MTTPTREQVTAAPLDAYSAEDRAFFEFWYAHMKDDLMQPPLHEVAHSVAKLIYTAGRDQGLREAKEVCEGKALASALAHVNTDEQAFHIKAEAARSCAAAIEQLRGK